MERSESDGPFEIVEEVERDRLVVKGERWGFHVASVKEWHGCVGALELKLFMNDAYRMGKEDAILQDAERIKELETDNEALQTQYAKVCQEKMELDAENDKLRRELKELKDAVLKAFPKCMNCQQPAVSYVEDEGMYCNQKCANDNGCDCDVQDFVLDDDWFNVGQLLGIVK